MPNHFEVQVQVGDKWLPRAAFFTEHDARCYAVMLQGNLGTKARILNRC